MKFGLFIITALGLIIAQSVEVFGCGGGSQPSGGSKCFVQICSRYPSNQIREADAQGSGAFGARRKGDRKHKGIDIVCPAGSRVYAPFQATVVRSLIVYSAIKYPRHDRKPYNTGIELRGTGPWAEYKVKMFYVKMRVDKEDRVSSGGFIGDMMDRASADEGMTNHVHVELYKNGDPEDPTPYVC